MQHEINQEIAYSRRLLVISVPETEPHCSGVAGETGNHGLLPVISVPETEPHCSEATHARVAAIMGE